MPDIAPPKGGSRLLIAEDHPAQLQTLTAIMQAEGFEVVGCATASEALKHLGREDVGVAVVDLRLPDLGETQLLEKLRSVAEKVHIIVHTGYGSYESARDAVNLGAFAYVEKAEYPDELLRHVHRAFQARLRRYAGELEDAVAQQVRELQRANAVLHVEIAEREQAEEALRESREQYRTLAEAAPDSIFIIDRDDRIEYVNSFGARQFGLQPQDLIGKWRRDLFPPETNAQQELDLRRVFQSGEPDYSEEKCSFGHRKMWLSTWLVPLRGDTGEVNAVLGVARDITELKLAEEETRHIKESYDRITDNADEVIFRVDAQGDHVSFANPAAERLLGYSLAEWLADPTLAFKIIHPDFAEEQRRLIERIHTHKKPIKNAVLGCVAKDGRKVIVEHTIVPVVNDEGDVCCFESIGRDITQREQAEEALRESEQRCREMTDCLPQPVFETDAQGTVTFVNQSALELLRYTQEDVERGIALFDTAAPRERERAAEDFLRVLRGERLDGIEYTAQTKTGDEFPVVIHAGPIVRDGGIAGVRGVAVDITERKQAEEELRQREAELAHVTRLHAMGELAAGLAHEINQPLYAITNYARGALRRLRKGAVHTGEFAQAMEQIFAEANRAARIIAHLRKLVGKREPSRSSVDVNDLVRGVATLIHAAARQGETIVHLELADELPPVLADSVQIEQVVINLARNALDALRDVPADRRELTIQTRLSNDEAIEVAVSDTGRGFAASVAEKVFDPFVTTKSDGLGMGLAISRSIIEAHGGRIWVASSAPQGTTVRFTLPLSVPDLSYEPRPRLLCPR